MKSGEYSCAPIDLVELNGKACKGVGGPLSGEWEDCGDCSGWGEG